MKKKLALDTHSYIWWASIAGAIISFAVQISKAFNWPFTADMGTQAMTIVNTILTMLVATGVLVDTSKSDKVNSSNQLDQLPTQVETPTFKDPTTMRKG